jgi:hypothetical protein
MRDARESPAQEFHYRRVGRRRCRQRYHGRLFGDAHLSVRAHENNDGLTGVNFKAKSINKI